MEFQELIRRRYSVRAYRPEPVSEEALRASSRPAGWRPPRRTGSRSGSSSSTPPAGAGARARLRPPLVPPGPVVLCVCGVPEEAWVRKDGRSHMDVDAAIVMDHLILAATDEGLGTCWIANFNMDAAREVFELRPGEVPLLLTTLGHAADHPGPRERRRLDSLVRRVR